MWEHAFDAGFQAPGTRSEKSPLGLSTVDPARHFHSEPADSAHFCERRPLSTAQWQERFLPKSRVDCTLFYRLLGRAINAKAVFYFAVARRFVGGNSGVSLVCDTIASSI